MDSNLNAFTAPTLCKLRGERESLAMTSEGLPQTGGSRWEIRSKKVIEPDLCQMHACPKGIH